MNIYPVTDKEGALFIDGPVAVCVSAGTETEILEAYDRISKLVRVCAHLTGKRHTQAGVPAVGSEPVPLDDRWGRTI